jgi:nicotinamide mononucleotide transporter
VSAVLAGLEPLLAPAFALWGSAVSWLEVAAFVLALATVALNIRVDARAWPLAIASSLLYFGLFWNSRLYGDASLQIFFAAVAAWGWWQWLYGKQDDGRPLAVRRLTPRGRWLTLAAVALAWPLTGLFLRRWTDTDVPWWDAFPTAASVVGQFLLGRKYVENWPTWIAVNVVSVGLFAYKGLWLTVILYAIFIAMALAGWRAWRRLLPLVRATG